MPCKLILLGRKGGWWLQEDYSPIEGEATAIFKGLQDTKYYTLGCKNLHIATDHQPLVAVGNPLLINGYVEHL